MYSTLELLFIIITIGIATLFIRAIFLFYLPKITQQPLVKRGMDAIPASMLVALVVPFTLFVDRNLSIWRDEVYAIGISIPIIYLTKKYSYGLIIAVIFYVLFTIYL